MTIQQQVDHLLEEAYRLPESARAAIAESLLGSLDESSEPISEEEAHQLATREALRRAEAYRLGKINARSWEEIYAHLQKKIQ